MTTPPVVAHLRAPAGDIPSQHWQGGPINCGVCCHASVFRLPSLIDDPEVRQTVRERQARDAARIGAAHG